MTLHQGPVATSKGGRKNSQRCLTCALLILALLGASFVFLLHPQPIAAHDAIAAQQLYQQLLDAKDNAKEVWERMSPAEQQAVMAYVKTARVERVATPISKTAAQGDGGEVTLSEDCRYGVGFWEAGYNGFNQMLWKYTLYMSWCGDGQWITYASNPYTTGDTYIAGWGYQGNVSGPYTVLGGAWYNQWEVAAQGKFTLTILPFGVVQEEYPYLNPVVWPDLTWSNWP